jgi:hypothetical protein
MRERVRARSRNHARGCEARALQSPARMIVVHGIDRFGKVDEVDGEYLVTRFHHLFLLPLVPIGSEWITKRDGDTIVGRVCRLSWKSVLAAYVRTWGVVMPAFLLAVASTGRTTLLFPATFIGALAMASLWSRKQRDPHELRRVAVQRPALGIALDPAQLPRDSVDILLPIVAERFEAVSGGRTAVEVAVHGASSEIQAAYAFVLLRLLSVTMHGIDAVNAHAVSLDLLRIHDVPATTDGPYRTMPTTAFAEPPLIAGYPLRPHCWYGVTATLASWVWCVHAMLTSHDLCFCGEEKSDFARAGVKKLAYESYPQWASQHAACPTGKQLAEYGGSVKDPWGEEYVIKCCDLPTGAVGIAVLSRGEDKREGTADDIKSWEQQ